MDKYNILVVDDEEDLCEILRFNLEKEGFSVAVAHSAEVAEQLPIATFHLLILDVMMDGMSGFDLGEIFKQSPTTASIPILFLTALDAESDLVRGFSLGADDYVTKPFSVGEVILRVKAILKRVYHSAAPKTNPHLISYQGLELDERSKSARLDNQPIELTKKEFEVLALLLQTIGEVQSREAILKHVWTDEVVVLDRTIDVVITRLRKKIGQYGSHIVTRFGFGYLFEDR